MLTAVAAAAGRGPAVGRGVSLLRRGCDAAMRAAAGIATDGLHHACARATRRRHHLALRRQPVAARA